MSLTSFLKIKDVREKFHELFPIPRLINTKKEILAPPLTTNYSLIGTAFDYLLRFYIKHLNPKAITKPWVGEVSVVLLRLAIKLDKEIKNYESLENIIATPEKRLIYNKVLKKLYQSIKNRRKLKKYLNSVYESARITLLIAKNRYSKFLEKGEKKSSLIIPSLKLAKLDTIYRVGIIPKDLESKEVDKNIMDLRNLISIVDPNLFKAKKICLLNPTFKKASELVKGADADLVIDDMLIDIKTTKYLQNKQDYFNQLIGYYTLYRIGGISGMPATNKIKRLGIYFSRHGYLQLYNIKNITVINDKDKFSEFVEWFKERAIQEFGKSDY